MDKFVLSVMVQNHAGVLSRVSGLFSRRGYNIVSLKPKKEGVCDDCGTTLVTRKDDNEETIKSRLEVYERQTKPLIDYYRDQNLLLEVDGSGSISEITKNIIAGMEAKWSH